jgi:hypothetical protein
MVGGRCATVTDEEGGCWEEEEEGGCCWDEDCGGCWEEEEEKEEEGKEMETMRRLGSKTKCSAEWAMVRQ